FFNTKTFISIKYLQYVMYVQIMGFQEIESPWYNRPNSKNPCFGLKKEGLFKLHLTPYILSNIGLWGEMVYFQVEKVQVCDEHICYSLGRDDILSLSTGMI
ncbi:unnamed protein product, partial [Owenia fusiformis]